MTRTPDRDERYRQAQAALEEYLARSAEAGAPSYSFESFVQAHPDVAAELRELHALCGDVERALERGQEVHAAQAAEVRRMLAALDSAGFEERYVVEGEVGKGGMGAVYRVVDRKLDRPLAMKVILGQAEASRTGKTPPLAPRQLARFLNEARITGQLDHPGIVPVHEVGVDDEGRAYFTMKLVKGRTLAEVFEAAAAGDPEWSTPRVLAVLLRVCEALAFAHARGVIHRDLKPANVMVGDFGEVYVMDWGLARRVGESEEPVQAAAAVDEELSAQLTLTKEGQLLGTPAYMSPEQARGELEQMGPPSDVYALGAMLYQLIAGHPPYARSGERPTSAQVIARILQGPPKPLDSRAAAPELISICAKAMARESGERYADTGALAADLSAFLEGRVVRAYETGAWAEARKWVERNRALAASLAAAVALLIVGLVTSLVFKAQADENLRLAEKRELETAAQAQIAQANATSARLAQQEAEARTADVLSLSAQKDLDELVARAETLWPPHPEMLPEYERWLAEAQVLLEGRPADVEQGIEKRPGLADHKLRLAELLARSRPETDPTRLAAAREHTSYPQLEAARGKRQWLLWMLGREPWPDPAEVEAAVELEQLPKSPEERLALILRRVGPEATELGDAPGAWVLATRAVDAADDESLPRALLTLAWAEARSGRLEEALATVESVMELSAAGVLPEEVAKLRSEVSRWLGEARAQRPNELVEHERKLTELELELGERRFDAVQDAWWQAQLTKLVRGLEALQDPDRGLMSSAVAEPFGWGIAKRHQFARTIGDRSVTGPEARQLWAEAIAAIVASPKYGGLEITPQMGLLPIGPDPNSGLWEFAHLMTGDPALRGPDGSLIPTEDMGIVMVLIPGGTFYRGAQSDDVAGPNYDQQATKDETPVHEVKLSPYFLSKYEMTQEQWSRSVGNNPSLYSLRSLESKLHPVEAVSWFDCRSVLMRLGLCLPSEAQWEYGARGGTQTPWSTGANRETLRGYANFADQAAKRGGATWLKIEEWPDLDDGWMTHAPVGTYAPNPYGLHDVHGNLWEWCMDSWVDYTEGKFKDPLASSGIAYRIYRGSCFTFSAKEARSSARSSTAPELRISTIGLRPSRMLAP